MAGRIEGVDRQQATLFPERLDEVVPGDALVRLIDGFVARLDVAAAGFVRAEPAGIGRPGYRPGDLLRLLSWGCLDGVRSSRELARACRRDLEAARLLCRLLCRLQADFRTIADWRETNGAARGRGRNGEPIGNPSDSGRPAPAAARLAPVSAVRPAARAAAAEVAAGAAPETAAADAAADAARERATKSPTATLIARDKLGFVPVFPVLRTVDPHGEYCNRTDLEHDAERDVTICPAGKELKPLPNRRTARSATRPRRPIAAAAR